MWFCLCMVAFACLLCMPDCPVLLSFSLALFLSAQPTSLEPLEQFSSRAFLPATMLGCSFEPCHGVQRHLFFLLQYGPVFCSLYSRSLSLGLFVYIDIYLYIDHYPGYFAGSYVSICFVRLHLRKLCAVLKTGAECKPSAHCKMNAMKCSRIEFS